VCAYFRERGLRFRLRVREGAATFAEELLSAVGLVHKRGIPCLVLRPLRNEGVAPALTIGTVRDDVTLRDHTEVVAAAFGWEPDVLARVFSTRLVADPSWRGYTGYLDGRPVASSQLFVTEGVAGIYYVATLAESRRRGFGEAMTRHALNEGAAAGCTMASLQASPMGEPVYRRMGFEQVSYYRTYVPQEG
jgi:ribosomal protein S18 acetylase RimI-like enzyme